MNDDEARTKREDILTELTRKWHAQDCGCSQDSCDTARSARQRAEDLTRLAAQGLRKRGWF